MTKTLDFFIDEFDKLNNVDEQETLLDILRRKLVENRRRQMKKEADQSIKDYHAGKCKSWNAKDIFGDK